MEKRILAKCGRKKAKCGRKKAPFGTQEAAILTAAGINAAASAAAAAIGANATKDAANRQAQATTAAAQRQAQAIKTQTESSKEYQLQAQNFIKDQNTESRELQKDIQMQLQMLTGQQNVNDRLEASKLVVKNGGMTKPRYSLRGNNMAFRVTDGGYVVPIGNTPEGYNLFEIRGNDHEHYHKAPGGKNKTGVGIKFADGNVIEGEGNQNTNQGEYMLQTPNAAYFISKHSIAGFNPAKAVNMGMHPLVAFNIQEQIKQINGIPDDGKKTSSPVENNKKLAGGLIPNIYNIYNQITPKLETYSNFDNLLEIDWSAIKKNDDKNNKKQIKQTLDELKSSLDSDYYDKVRAGVLGLNDPIRESDYTDELFKLYRDGDTNSHIFTVTSSVVRSSYTGLKDYKNIESNVKNKKKEIEDKYKKIQDRVDKAAKFTLKDGRYQVSISGHGDDLDLDNESMQQLNLYIKLVTEQVIKMTTIHSLAFSYKLDALKDKMMQDKKILYIAMNKVLKDKNIRNGEMD